MLSNGISSRLQRLQSAKKCNTCHERPPQKPSAGTISMGHGLQTAAHTIVVPARNGLAADLIKKFNQMSVAGCDRPATIGRSAVPHRHPLNTSAHQSPHMSAASDDDGESDHESDGGDSHGAAPESIDDTASLDYDDDSHSCASIASDSSTAVGGESHATFQEAESETSASKGTSPFLSDSELNRALLEIREFGRNMNISLLDDEM
ncbi:hypothetical protein GGH94_002150 [Coemansia aciculifera]|uniref:Uncharacterized protein n=1 Tax=Coemansia aciculifera TaxID=417176 RepID=A0A9W8IPK4_9FUNG|nr:hypothetical protein GGH94_002150 [Coemansia aciculifera]KAJ2875108.1 hypothetical protein GGH93_001866 [Coemansia aciculifera]KAJ2885818.1 hypothetical protein H4R27_001109 [Coemansia aciculifera]